MIKPRYSAQIKVVGVEAVRRLALCTFDFGLLELRCDRTVVATARPDSPALYYRDQPDPNIIYLGSGLVTAYTAELAEVLDLTTLMHPVYTVAAERGDKNGRMPAIVFIVPKPAESTVAATR